MSDLPPIKTEAPVTLRLVDPEISPSEAPIEERMDLEKTRELHQQLRKGSKAPQLVSAVSQAMGGSLIKPTANDIQIIERMHAAGGRFRCCGLCRHFNFTAGQECLINGGAVELFDAHGGRLAIHMGDWRRYGVCEAAEGLMLAPYEAIACEKYQERRRSTFGRILGGVWKRINEI